MIISTCAWASGAGWRCSACSSWHCGANRRQNCSSNAKCDRRLAQVCCEKASGREFHFAMVIRWRCGRRSAGLGEWSCQICVDAAEVGRVEDGPDIAIGTDKQAVALGEAELVRRVAQFRL